MLKLCGPLNERGIHTCSPELKGTGCREFERNRPDFTCYDLLLTLFGMYEARSSRLDLTIDDFEGKDCPFVWIMDKLDREMYTSAFKKCYSIHGNKYDGYSITFGNRKGDTKIMQQLVIYEKDKVAAIEDALRYFNIITESQAQKLGFLWYNKLILFVGGNMILDIEECLNEIGTWYSEKPTEFGLQNIESYFVNSGIRSVSGKLFGLSNRYKGYKSVASSFYNLIRGIIDLIEQYHEPDIVDRVKRKWKKIIVAYFDIILFNQMYEHIKEIYFGIGGNNTNADDYGGNKKVLAVGLINIEEDDIYVNREIQRIVELSIGTNYYVYPRVACTISAFENLVKKYNFDIVHLAGHLLMIIN